QKGTVSLPLTLLRLLQSKVNYTGVGSEVAMRSNYSEVQEDTEYGSVQVAALQANNDRARLVSKGVKGLVACMATLMVMGVVVSHFNQFGSSGFVNFKKASKDNFDSLGRFIIQEYDTKPGFASFLPGIGGKYGIPMWAFYLNRGQAIASFGIESKDNPMYEFESATKAYQQTPLTGFRTFMKGSANGKKFDYQPFMEKTTGKSSRDMYVGMNEVEIEDYNAELGIQTNVLYFNLVEEAFPGLVRTVTVTNRGKQPLSVEMLDGPVKFLPYGVTDAPMKNLPTTEEAWFAVYNMDVDQTLPWYKETSSTADSDIVTPVIKGNYAFSWVKGSDSRLPFIADPDVVFGQDKTLFEPVEFLAADSLEAVVNATQAPVARTAVALAASAFVLKPGENITVHSLYGQAQDLDALVNHVVPTAMAKGYLDTKSDRAHELLDEITSPVATSTANGIFDAFVRYNFLDNVMRGGYPLLLGSSPETQKVYHIYSRIHGDLERDYNPFYIQPTYFSQGPGNFRDVNQNRPVMFQPDMGPSNALNFYTLIQADGYNPLTVASPTWFLSPDDQDALVAAAVAPGDAESEAQLRAVLSSQTLAPGDIAMFAYGNTALLLDADALLDLAADKAQEYFNAAFGEGYWSDHWSYNLDLISSYLAVFPDMEADMLWNNTVKTFISPVYVLPRSIKYVLLGDTPRQVAPVVYKQPGGATGYWPCNTWQCRAGDEASGGVAWESYEMTLAAKVLLLGTVKFAMLDPQGMGVEMEGGKPGWLDAMNGLPSLFGSTTPEAFELYRTLDYLNSATRFGVDTAVPEELDTLLQAIRTNLAALNDGREGRAGGGHWERGGGASSGSERGLGTPDTTCTLGDFNYWDQTRTALETYSASLTSTFSGNEVAWSAADLGSLLASMLAPRAWASRHGGRWAAAPPPLLSWEPTPHGAEQHLLGQPQHRGAGHGAHGAAHVPGGLRAPLQGDEEPGGEAGEVRQRGRLGRQGRGARHVQDLREPGRTGPCHRPHQELPGGLAGARVRLDAHELQVLPGAAARGAVRPVLGRGAGGHDPLDGRGGVRPVAAGGLLLHCLLGLPGQEGLGPGLRGAALGHNGRVHQHVEPDVRRAAALHRGRDLRRAEPVPGAGAARLPLRRGHAGGLLHLPGRRERDLREPGDEGHLVPRPGGHLGGLELGGQARRGGRRAG
ncbi:unnamed protein product, partial [Heterosigma akashiwo]